MAKSDPSTWSKKYAQDVARAQAKGFASPYYEKKARTLAAFGLTPAEKRSAKAQQEGFKSYWQKRETLKDIKKESQQLYSTKKEQKAYQIEQFNRDVALLKATGKEYFEQVRQNIYDGADKVLSPDDPSREIYIQFVYECEIARQASPDGRVPQEVKDRFYTYLLAQGMTSGQAMAIYAPMLRVLY